MVIKETRSVLRLTLLKIESATRFQIMDEAVYVSFRANVLAKDMNESVPPL